MKKLFLVCIFFTAMAASAQTSTELLGKWQLVKWTKKGKEKDIMKEYKTDQVFQVFKEGGNFESVVGDKVRKSEWKLSADNKMLTLITIVGTIDFTVDYFDPEKRIITTPMMGTLEYKKVKE